MSETKTQGGFVGDPAAALTVSTAGGCCGNAPAETGTTLAQTSTAETGTAAAPCCGTATEAKDASSCCGATAKADAVSSGASCCG